jgi:predicted amidohydrolase
MYANRSIIFERNYGVSHVPAGGDQITTVSQPDWESFVGSMDDLSQNVQQVGSLILSPELITSSDISLSAIRESREVIQDRVSEAAALTTKFPESTLLLGTVVFDETVVKPRNALVFLKNGMEIGRTHKVTPLGTPEREALLVSAEPSDIQKPKPDTMAIICSDMIEHPYIDDKVSTLLVSGCWGVPLGRVGWPASPDHRLVKAIELTTEDLFARYHNLQTVVMADRVPSPSTAKAPFNFVARRLK